jgi:hypothetical protein
MPSSASATDTMSPRTSHADTIPVPPPLPPVKTQNELAEELTLGVNFFISIQHVIPVKTATESFTAYLITVKEGNVERTILKNYSQLHS